MTATANHRAGLADARPYAGSFVPWPVPAALGLALGIVAAATFAWGIASTVAAGAAALSASPAARWRLTHLTRLPPHFWPVLFLAIAAGAGRLQWHTAHMARQSTTVADLLGVETRWSGYFDGDTFTSADPVRVRMTPVSRFDLPIGRLVLVGSAELAPGKRNPGGFDYRGYLSRRGVVAQLFVAEVVSAAPVFSLRERLSRGVAAGLPPDLAALMQAMTLGLRDDLGTVRDSFTASGLAHLLSLSGLHFGVLLAAASRLTTRLGAARPYALMVLTCAFMTLVGAAPSVLRAATMALAALIGLASGAGRFEPFTVLTLAFVIGLLATPQMLFDISLQLSYLALAGLLLFAGPLAEKMGVGTNSRHPRLLQAVVGGCSMSVAAQLPSLSLVAGAFGTVPLVAPLVNVVAVPLAALAVPLGFAAGLIGLVSQHLAWLVNRLTLVTARPITWLADVGAQAPSLAWGEVSWLGHVSWAAFVVAAALWVRGRLRLRRLLLVMLAGGGVCHAAGSAQQPPDLWFLDVGQGDAILLRLPGRFEVLIDGGGSPFSDDDVGRRVVVPALRALGVDELEVVVATHPDADHVEGLFSVLEEVAVGTLVTGPEWPDVALDQRLRELAEARGTDVHQAQRGETLVLGGPRQAATFEVLNPPAGTGGSSSNESSVVLLLRYRGQAVALLTGDSGIPTEEWLAVPHVELLQVGHHGSRFSTGDHLLRAASPSVAVISVGDNNYGHPHPDVLRRLEDHGVRTYLTKRDGAVRLDLGRGGEISVMVVDEHRP